MAKTLYNIAVWQKQYSSLAHYITLAYVHVRERRNMFQLLYAAQIEATALYFQEGAASVTA